MGEKVRQWFRELLELFFQAASLLIDTLRTFFLIVLSILGPISFALAVYDGFQSTLTTWLSRYILSLIHILRSKKKGDSQRVLALYGTQDQRYW